MEIAAIIIAIPASLYFIMQIVKTAQISRATKTIVEAIEAGVSKLEEYLDEE